MQFELNEGTGAAWFQSRDEFVQGYVEAMFWTDCNEDHEDEGLGSDSHVGELASEAKESIARDCARFEKLAIHLLARVYDHNYSKEQAGHDFWLTRNGHGAGFWGREELSEGDLGDRLSDIAHTFGESNLYRGDDGKLYI